VGEEHGTGRNGAVMADVQVLAYQDIKMGGLFEADSVAGNKLNEDILCELNDYMQNGYRYEGSEKCTY
jgi:hypothetical protein